MKRKIFSMMLVLGMSVCCAFSASTTVRALTLEEAQQQVEAEESGSNRGSQESSNSSSRNSSNDSESSYSSNNSSNTQQSGNSGDSGSIYGSDEDMDKSEGITNYFRSYRPITEDNMNTAQKFANPIVSFCGSLAGFVMLVTGAGIFVITSFDMAYLCLPFTRNWLYAGGQQAQGGMSGGMGMGGMGGYGSHGIGGFGAMSGGTGGQPKTIQWVSDDAISALNEATGGQAQGAMSGGMGMGMGGMMGGMQPQAQQGQTKQVLLVYFKKRVFFLIMFGVCSVILTSSVLLNCGINIAQLIFKLIGAFNNALGGAF